MGWLDSLRKRKPEEPMKRLLFFSQEELADESFAVIRVTWFLDGKIAGVSDTATGLYDGDVIGEFSLDFVEAFYVGGDVSVVTYDPPYWAFMNYGASLASFSVTRDLRNHSATAWLGKLPRRITTLCWRF